MPKIRISDLNIYIDSEIWTIDPNFYDFRYDFETPEINCRVIFSNGYQRVNDDCRNIFSNESRSIYYTKNMILIIFNEMNIPSCIYASEDWSNCQIYINPAYYKPNDEKNVKFVKEGLSAAIKMIYTSALLCRNAVLVHSATIEWMGKGLLFAAPSQIGKSTHAHLWYEKYGVTILDGDVTACRIIKGLPTVYGLPWCGTSMEYINASLPLGSIIFLEQDVRNSIRKLNIADAAVRLYARCFLYIWDEKMADCALEIITEIASTIDCYLLKCRPDFEAVELVKKCLEKN